MSTVDQVTDFKLGEPKNMVRVSDLIKAINAHFDTLAKQEPVNPAFDPREGFEHFCCSADWNNKDERIPDRFRWLVAFAVEGECEADYVHLGAIIQGTEPTTYLDFGFAKLWAGPARAREVANEVQRFLNASRWN